MSKKQNRPAMIATISRAIQYLRHPDMPHLPGYEPPGRIADFLTTCIDLLDRSGPIPEKKYVLGDLQIAADYLSKFAIRTTNIARSLREVIRDLK